MIERVANENYLVRKGGRVIEKATMIIIPTSRIHNDPEIYPDPLTFDPDRMTKEKMQQRHPSSFLAFGDGPRGCPGQRLVISHIKLGIISLLSNFRFSVNARTASPTDLISSNSIKLDIWLDMQQL